MKKTFILIPLILLTASFAVAQEDYHKLEIGANYFSITSADGFVGDRFERVNYANQEHNIPTTTTSLVGSRESQRRKNHIGYDASVVYNFSRYLGVKFNVTSGNGADSSTSLPTVIFFNPQLSFPLSDAARSKITNHNFMGGIQYKDNSKEKRLKPFAHFLVGVAMQKTTFKPGPNSPQYTAEQPFDKRITALVGGTSLKNNGLTYDIGGGLDVRVNKRFDIRVVQFDFNPVIVNRQILRKMGDSVNTGLTFLGFGAPIIPDPAIVNTDVTIPKRTQYNFRVGFGIVFH